VNKGLPTGEDQAVKQPAGLADYLMDFIKGQLPCFREAAVAVPALVCAFAGYLNLQEAREHDKSLKNLGIEELSKLPLNS
jgi:hypothetical protein